MIVNAVCANDVAYGQFKQYFSFAESVKIGKNVM